MTPPHRRPEPWFRAAARTALFFAVVLSALGLAGCGEDSSPRGRRLRLGIAPKRAADDYWNAVHAGADEAVAELRQRNIHVELLWRGTEVEDDHAGQVRIIEELARSRVDVLVVSPQDRDLMAETVSKVIRQGIPVIAFDSEINTPLVTTYVGTDNYGGGETAAKYVATLVPAQGRVLMQRYLAGSGSSMEREAGFANYLREHHPGIRLLPWNTYAGAVREESLKTCRAALKRWNGQFDAVFVSTMAAGQEMLRAMLEAGVAGKIPLVVFDTSPFLLNGLRQGTVNALIPQSEKEIGRQAVLLASRRILGEDLPATQYTPVTVVTQANLNQPAIRQLLQPLPPPRDATRLLGGGR